MEEHPSPLSERGVKLETLDLEEVEEPCLICSTPGGRWSSFSKLFELIIPLPPEESLEDIEEDSCLKPHLCSLFILNKLLQLPKTEVQQLLEDTGGIHPGNWFSLCDTCTLFVRQALEIHNQVLRLSKRLEGIGRELRASLRRTVRSDEDLEGGSVSEFTCVRTQIRRHFKKIHSGTPSGHHRRPSGIPRTRLRHSAFFRKAKTVAPRPPQQTQAPKRTPVVTALIVEDVVIDDDDWGGGDDFLPMDDGDDAADSDFEDLEEAKRKRICAQRKPAPLPSSSSPSKPVNYHHRKIISKEPKPPPRKRGRPPGKKPPQSKSLRMKKFCCDRCDYRCYEKHDFERHKVSHRVTDNFEYLNNSGGLIRCKLCGVEDNKFGMYTHMRHVHNLSARNKLPPNHLCELCSKMFATGHTLRMHMRTVHEGIVTPKPYQCDTCGSGFINKRHFEDHVAKHLNHEEDPFSCEECGGTFANRSNLRAHFLKYHHTTAGEGGGEGGVVGEEDTKDGIGEAGRASIPTARPIPTVNCKHCGLQGMSFKEWRKHLTTVHTDLYKFKCSMCDASYLRSEDLAHHMRSKHKE